MPRSKLALALVVALPCAGCLGDSASRDPATTASLPASTTWVGAASWSVPTQLSRITEASEARGESTALVWVPRTGYVTGAPDVIATIGQPLRGVPGRNRTVEPCRETVLSEASRLGARDVEAVSAGPEQTDDQGRIFAPVDMRITYRVPGGYELRRATLTCILDRQGRIVDAYP